MRPGAPRERHDERVNRAGALRRPVFIGFVAGARRCAFPCRPRGTIAGAENSRRRHDTMRGMTASTSFFNLYVRGFARVAVAVPASRVADPAYNAAQTVRMMGEASQAGAALVVFPELGLSGYTCDDLFHQQALLDACEAALAQVVEASVNLPIATVVGLPFRVDQLLFNCGAVVHRGRVLGIVPKTYFPNYAEFYEARQFNPAAATTTTEVELFGQLVPFGSETGFEAQDLPLLKFHVEICEYVWRPIPPSSYAALAG